jgi:hypothetical protein
MFPTGFRMPMANVSARTLRNTRLREALIGDDDRILGFTAFGVEASELMAAVQTAMIGRLPYTSPATSGPSTAAEGLIGLFAAAGGTRAQKEIRSHIGRDGRQGKKFMQR